MRVAKAVLVAALTVLMSERSPPKRTITRLREIGELPLGAPPFFSNDEPKQYFALGGVLFYSKFLSTRGLTCADCHSPPDCTTAPRNLRKMFPAITVTRKIPPLANLYSLSTFMWDGRVSSLRAQAMLPLESACEMAIEWTAATRLTSGLRESEPIRRANRSEQLSRTDIARALAEYTGRIVSGDSRFDRFFYGHDDNAITAQEKKGLALFRDKARCTSCHSINGAFASFTDGMFHTLGIGYLRNSFQDKGRGAYTRAEIDEGAFRTPTLRNVTRTAPYMHDGSLPDLDAVLKFYNDGGKGNVPHKDTKLTALNLSEEEIADIKAFLKTLESEVCVLKPKDAL
jgi:cytochrome c peroxidase